MYRTKLIFYFSLNVCSEYFTVEMFTETHPENSKFGCSLNFLLNKSVVNESLHGVTGFCKTH
jgi:hypothetical protein